MYSDRMFAALLYEHRAYERDVNIGSAGFVIGLAIVFLGFLNKGFFESFSVLVAFTGVLLMFFSVILVFLNADRMSQCAEELRSFPDFEKDDPFFQRMGRSSWARAGGITLVFFVLAAMVLAIILTVKCL